jgi:hypothetical protein
MSSQSKGRLVAAKTRPVGARCETRTSRHTAKGKGVECPPRHENGRFARIKDRRASK